MVTHATELTRESRLRDVERFLALSLAFDQIHKENVAGDFAELGVYKLKRDRGFNSPLLHQLFI